jgi:E-phenylitaconyl-CoA hydratase
MLLTGDAMDAETAARWGLVNRVVPMKDLMNEALLVAEKIASGAPLAMQAAKELAIRARDMPLSTGLRFEQLVLQMLQSTEDASEGPSAFAQKRVPEFKGK